MNRMNCKRKGGERRVRKWKRFKKLRKIENQKVNNPNDYI